MVRALGAAPIRALIVEDNRDICDNIAAYLEKCGYILDFAYKVNRDPSTFVITVRGSKIIKDVKITLYKTLPVQ